nr:acyltransferase family protein [Methylobrevis albus]
MAGASTARVDWVDYAKGICIIFVVMMHSVEGVERLAGAHGWLGTVVDFARPFRMPDFFLISGLFLARVIDRPGRVFYDRRVVHFFYFYVLWLTIQFAVKAPGFVADQGLAATVERYLAAILYDPFGTLWFIWILPVFAVTVRLTRKVPPAIIFAIAAGLEISNIQAGVTPENVLGYTALNEFAARFVYFYAGYWAAPLIFRIAGHVADRPLAAVAGLLVWGLVNGTLVFSGLATLPVVSLLLGFAGAGAIIAAATLVTRLGARFTPARAFQFLGANSIVIYLAFFLPMGAMRTVLLKTGVIDDVGTMSALVTLAGVTGPLVIWWFARRFGLNFLFSRPRWARIERPADRRQPAGMQPAE